MSEIVKTWSEWLTSSRFSYMTDIQKQQTLLWLTQVRDKILDRANLLEGDTLIDIGSGTGLLAFGAYERLNGKGKVIISDAFQDCLDSCKSIAEACEVTSGIDYLLSDASDIKLPKNSVDVVVLRSVLVHILKKYPAIKEFYRILKPGGRISFFEPIIRKNTRYYEIMDPAKYTNYERLKEIEEILMSDSQDPLMNFDDDSLRADMEKAGFKNIDTEIVVQTSVYQVSASMIDPWFNTPPSPGTLTVKQKYEKFMSKEDVETFIETLKVDLDGREIVLNSPTAYIYAEK